MNEIEKLLCVCGHKYSEHIFYKSTFEQYDPLFWKCNGEVVGENQCPCYKYITIKNKQKGK